MRFADAKVGVVCWLLLQDVLCLVKCLPVDTASRDGEVARLEGQDAVVGAKKKVEVAEYVLLTEDYDDHPVFEGKDGFEFADRIERPIDDGIAGQPVDESDQELSRDGCPPHSVPTCPTKCDPSCKKPLAMSFQCPQSSTCLKKSCTCMGGYVFDDISRKCILSQYCPEKCTENEVWQLCPSACHVNCGNYKERENATCAEDPRDDYECIAGCVCKQGFIRDLITGVCVTRDLCNSIVKELEVKKDRYPCPANEHWEDCLPPLRCTRYCHGKDILTRSKSQCQFTEECRKGCVCNKNYIRLNVDAKCILESECTVMLKYIET